MDAILALICSKIGGLSQVPNRLGQLYFVDFVARKSCQLTHVGPPNVARNRKRQKLMSFHFAAYGSYVHTYAPAGL